MSGAWADVVCTCGKPLGAYRKCFTALKTRLLEAKEAETPDARPGTFIARDAAYENDVDLEPLFEMLRLDHICCRMRLTGTFELSQIC